MNKILTFLLCFITIAISVPVEAQDKPIPAMNFGGNVQTTDMIPVSRANQNYYVNVNTLATLGVGSNLYANGSNLAVVTGTSGAFIPLLNQGLTFSGSDTFSQNTNFLNGITFGNLTGETQCLEVNSSGTVIGTGSACGSGGGSITSVFGRSGPAITAQTGDYTVSQITGAAPLASPTFTGTVTLPSGTTVNGVTLESAGSSSSFLNGSGTYTTPNSMVYPSAGIPLSTGTAWGTSITPGTGVSTALSNAINASGGLVSYSGALGTPTSGVATNLTGTAGGLSIGGNAATATALASTPTPCSTGQAPTGILANGNSTGCASIGGGSGTVTNVSGGTSNGITIGVATGTTTPVVTVTGVGAISPSSVAATGAVSGTTGTFTGGVTANVTGNASTVTTIPTLSGDVSNTGNATAISATTVTGKALTGFSAGAGTVSATDTILSAFNKLVGNIAALLPSSSPTFTGTLTGPTVNVTGLTASSAVATDGSKNLVSVANTGTGNNVLATSPTLTTPNLGTPSALNLANATGSTIAGGGTGSSTAATALSSLLGNPTSGTYSASCTGTSCTPVAASSGGTPAGNQGQIQINGGSGTNAALTSIANAFCGLTANTFAFASADCASFFGYYDPRWYGAKFNGQYRTDGTTAASAATLSSTGYSFTSADIGKKISVWAGTPTTLTAGATTSGSQVVTVASTTGLTNGENIQGPGIPVGNYVTGVFSATQFTMQFSASSTNTGQTFEAYPIVNTTISSVAGNIATLATNLSATISSSAFFAFGTDDTTADQAAFAAAGTAGGGLIQLPTGMTITSASLVVNNRVSVRGQGAGKSIIKWLSTADEGGNPIIVGYIQANSITCGPVGAATLQSDNQFSYFEVDGLSATAATFNVSNKGIALACNTRSVVDHVYVHDTPATSVATDEGMPTQVTNNVIDNCGRLGGGNPGNNCIGEGTLGLPGEAYIITGNVMHNPDHYGPFIESQGTSSVYLSTSVIANNIVYQGGNSQQTTGGGTTATAAIGNSGAAGMIITGNYVYGLAALSAENYFGITTDGGTLNEFQGAGTQTTIEDNHVYGLPIVVNYLIVGPSQAAHILIDANHIINSNGAGIEVITTTAGGNAQGIQITNNQVFNAQSSCILVAGSGTMKNLVVSGNVGVDCGISTVTAYRRAGFAIAAPITNLTMHGNYFYDDGAATQQYALAVNTSIAVTGADISVNNFSGNVTSAIDILGTITGIVQNNVGMPAPTITGCGTVTGVTSAGTGYGGFTSNSASCAPLVTPYGTANIIAPNGWHCQFTDESTGLNIGQTGHSTTTCTGSGTVTSGDYISYSIGPY